MCKKCEELEKRIKQIESRLEYLESMEIPDVKDDLRRLENTVDSFRFTNS